MVVHLIGLELRRQWRNLALLVVLVTLVVGLVLATVAGAERSRTAFARYAERAVAATVFATGPSDALAKLESHPEVAASVPFEVPAVFPSEGYFPAAVVDDRAFRDMFRFRVVDGRAPDPSAPLEVALSERLARASGLGPGDRIPMDSFSPAGSELLDDEEVYEPDGPAFSLEVVGVVRDLGDIASRASDLTLVLLMPAFRDRFGTDVIGSQLAGHLVAMAPDADLASLGDISEDLGVELDASLGGDVALGQAHPTMSAIATALRVFAAVVALAGLATIGLVSSRTQQDAVVDDRTLAALGVSRPARLARLAGPGIVAVAVGTLAGVVVAIFSSRWFPIGLARRAEPDLGIHVDGRLLIPGGALAFSAGSLAVMALAGLATRPARGAASTSTLARTAARGGGAPSVVTGLTFATGRGDTNGSGGRTAIIGTAAGVLGVVAATMFATNIDRLVEVPARFGWGWDANIAGAETSGLPGDRLDTSVLLGDDELEAVAEVVFQLPATVDGQPEPIIAAQDLKGHVGPVVLEGREPGASDELALGSVSLRTLRRSIGDEVEVDLGEGPQPMTITARIALPVSEDGGSSRVGGFMTARAAEALGFDGRCDDDENCYRNIALRLRDGADIGEVVARYEDPEAVVVVDLPTPPGEVERLTAVEQLPRYLAGFLVLLGAVSVVYAAGTTVRRRRRDLAVLRVLGMSKRQLRSVVFVQVLALTAGGVLLGAVTGVAAGRYVWRLVVDSIDLPYAPEAPVAAIILVPLAALTLAQVAASIPRRAAGRIQAAHVLRAE